MNVNNEEELQDVLFTYWRGLRKLDEEYKKQCLMTWRSISIHGKSLTLCSGMVAQYIKKYKQRVGYPNWDADPAWALEEDVPL